MVTILKFLFVNNNFCIIIIVYIPYERYAMKRGLLMNKHTVYLGGKRYVLLSEDSEEYVTTLAAEVNEELKRISEAMPAAESRSCALLCAMNYADEKYKQIARNKSLSGNAKTVMIQADKQSKQIIELKDKLSRSEETVRMLNNHNVELERTVKELTEKRDTLTDLAERLEAELNAVRLELEQRPLPEEKPAEKPKASEGYVPSRQISLFDYEQD